MIDFEHFSLFFAAFLAATLLPGGAEIALLVFVGKFGQESLALLIATLGNSLGSFFTFYLGRLGKLAWASKYMKIPQNRITELKGRIQRSGSILSFFCFVPIIGDPLALALGYFRVARLPFLIWMTLGKLTRFILILVAGKPMMSLLFP